jgi:hypothetical protein
MRHIRASLQYVHAALTTQSTGATVAPMTMLTAQLRALPAHRAAKSPQFARDLAARFNRIDGVGVKVPKPRPALVPNGGARARNAPIAQDAFASNVAVFAYDDSSGVWLDAQYLNTTTGDYDLMVSYDSNVSLWYGTYDTTTSTATIVAPGQFGYDCNIPPGTADVSYTYDAYFWAPSDPTVGYVASTADQSGYYQIDYVDAKGVSGTAYAYVLPDDAALGSYYFIWDDGTCAQGTHIYISFDSTGNYFTLNGVDAPFSMSGISTSTQPGYFGGNVRWDVVGADGYNYAVTATVTYLGAPPATACPSGALVVPANPATCPAGCSLDSSFGICTANGTYDPTTGVGMSCELYAVDSSLVICAVGCTLATDGFCYDSAGSICY